MRDRSARDASNSANVASIRPRAFLDGLPGFFAGSEVIESSVGAVVVDGSMGGGVIGDLRDTPAGSEISELTTRCGDGGLSEAAGSSRGAWKGASGVPGSLGGSGVQRLAT